MSKAEVSPVLSSFARDAIREKATRELSAIDGALAACDDVLATKGSLTDAAASLTAFLGGLSTLDSDSATIARAKKLRKLLDEARDAAEGIVTALDVEARRKAAGEKREALVTELKRLGIEVEALPARARAEEAQDA